MPGPTFAAIAPDGSLLCKSSADDLDSAGETLEMACLLGSTVATLRNIDSFDVWRWQDGPTEPVCAVMLRDEWTPAEVAAWLQ